MNADDWCGCQYESNHNSCSGTSYIDWLDERSPKCIDIFEESQPSLFDSAEHTITTESAQSPLLKFMRHKLGNKYKLWIKDEWTQWAQFFSPQRGNMFDVLWCIDYKKDLSEVAGQNGNYSKFTMAG